MSTERPLSYVALTRAARGLTRSQRERRLSRARAAPAAARAAVLEPRGPRAAPDAAAAWRRAGQRVHGWFCDPGRLEREFAHPTRRARRRRGGDPGPARTAHRRLRVDAGHQP